MIEKPPVGNEMNSYEELFDREKEKERRKEIRKSVEQAIQRSLYGVGFRRDGNSKWARKVGNTWHLLYLQRGKFSHEYFLEIGKCDESSVPEDEKPDIVSHCSGSNQNRIGGIVSEIYHAQHAEDEEVESNAVEEVDRINKALNFELEISDKHEKYPDEYYFPSVSDDEIEEKTNTISGALEEYVLPWFDKNFNKKVSDS